jgi:hypothetical protein
MEENNKGFIFISNDKEADTTIKVNYKGFVFFDVYGLENDKIYKIVEQIQDNLIIQKTSDLIWEVF